MPKQAQNRRKGSSESFARTRRDGRTVVDAAKLLKNESVRTMIRKMATTRSGFTVVKSSG